MSTKQALTDHLYDTVQLFGQLLKSLDGSHTDKTTQQILVELVEKEDVMQQIAIRLERQQQVQQSISLLRELIQDADTRIMNLARSLGDMEQRLNDAQHDRKALTNVEGVVTKQSFSVSDLTVLAERLAMMSFSPADFLERKGVSLSKPPAPLEAAESVSRLHIPLADLVAGVELEERIRAEKEAQEAQVAEISEEALLSLSALSGWKPGDPIPSHHLAALSEVTTGHTNHVTKSTAPQLDSFELNPDEVEEEVEDQGFDSDDELPDLSDEEDLL